MVSVAVSVTSSATRFVTSKTTAPLATFETPLGGVIEAELPPFPLSATVLPLTVLPFASRRRTTTKSLLVPSAAIVPPPTPTCDCVASTAPTVFPASATWSTFRFGEPSPTCVKSLPMLAASWNAFVPASG